MPRELLEWRSEMNTKMLRLDRLPVIVRNDLSFERLEWNDREEQQRRSAGDRANAELARWSAGARRDQ
jgi:hypothetical protein